MASAVIQVDGVAFLVRGHPCRLGGILHHVASLLLVALLDSVEVGGVLLGGDGEVNAVSFISIAYLINFFFF